MIQDGFFLSSLLWPRSRARSVVGRVVGRGQGRGSTFFCSDDEKIEREMLSYSDMIIVPNPKSGYLKIKKKNKREKERRGWTTKVRVYDSNKEGRKEGRNFFL